MKKQLKKPYIYILGTLIVLTYVFIYKLAHGLELPFYGFIGCVGYIIALYVYMNVLSWLLERMGICE